MPSVPPTLSQRVRAACQCALRGGCFFTGRGSLRFEHSPRELLPWEIVLGRLLDAAHTRDLAEFETWNLYRDTAESRGAPPLVSILWSESGQTIHVVRRILTHAFEAYEDTPGVVLSRAVQKWTVELVGTISPAEHGGDELAAEIGLYVFLAVVGTSRLPITSLESPLPAFSLGQLAYLPDLANSEQPWSDAAEFLRAALGQDRTVDQHAKALEIALRASEPHDLSPIVGVLEATSGQRSQGWLARLFREVFNRAALSPYTGFADSVVGLLLSLAEQHVVGPEEAVDTLGYMLRNLCRHLTAFDLVVFHNFGANYPDALFLDTLLTAYVRLAERRIDLLEHLTDDGKHAVKKRRRRRALRQACLLRKHYEGHRVPDVPTSMGDNARVLPAPFVHVPDEQILQTAARRRRLFESRTVEDLLGMTGRKLLEQSLADLEQPDELRELGTALYLDRPLGLLKTPGEVDRTGLLSYVAVSRSVVRRRVAQLKAAGWLAAEDAQRLSLAASKLSLRGIAVAELGAHPRPAVVSLADAMDAAGDFIVERTTRGSLDELLSHYDLQVLAQIVPQTVQWLQHGNDVIMVQHSGEERSIATPVLRAYDRAGTLRLELGFDAAPDDDSGLPGPRYCERGGVELPRRLRLLRAAELTDRKEQMHERTGEMAVWLEVRGAGRLKK